MTIPTDMRDLLIRLDQQVRDGFLAVNAKLDRMEHRADGQEQRIQKIELELADRPVMKAQFVKALNDIAALDDAIKEGRTTAKNIKVALGGAAVLLVPTLSALIGKMFGVL